MRVAWAHQDQQLLREAIWKWLTRPAEEGTTRHRTGTRRDGLIAYAFELWIAHLALLERVVEIAPVGWRELQASELMGLEMLRAGRQRFAAEYRRCEECGAAVRGKICPRCGALEAKAAGI